LSTRSTASGDPRLGEACLNGNEREFLVLTYEGAIAVCAIHQADRLSCYAGPDDSEPNLSRLGTQEWNRVKEKTREDVERTAAELLQLYASPRELVAGHAFNPDSPWQHELKHPSPMSRRKISCAPWRKSNPTWSAPTRWIA
jgi:transcription-repair coupling factor (superfamily II helicase)